MKRIAAMILTVLMMCVSCGTVLAEASGSAQAQYSTTRLFIETLEENNLRYEYLGIDSDGDEKVIIENTDSDLGITYTIYYYFDDDCLNVDMRIWDFVTFNGEDYVDALYACNSSNCDWKYVTFYVESDNSVTAAMDVILRGDSAGEVTLEASLHIVSIVGSAYEDHFAGIDLR